MKRSLIALRDAELEYPWCSERFARRLVDQCRVPFHRIGRRIYFDRADLDAYADAQRVELPQRARLRGVS